MNIIQILDAEQMAAANKTIPDFAPGDTVSVQVKVKESESEGKGKGERVRTRIQSFEGVVIAKRKRGLNSAFTVRKISHGVSVERVFQTYSPIIDSIELKRRGEVRRAKLYYMRKLRGKAARIKEKLPAKNNKSVVESNPVNPNESPEG